MRVPSEKACQRRCTLIGLTPGAFASGRVLQWVAPKLGCTAETLRTWVRQEQRDAGHRPGLTTSECDRLKELER